MNVHTQRAHVWTEKEASQAPAAAQCLIGDVFTLGAALALSESLYDAFTRTNLPDATMTFRAVPSLFSQPV